MTKDGVHLADNNLINRDGSFCYIIINVEPADSGQYECIVSNIAGSVSSRIANVYIFGMLVYMIIRMYAIAYCIIITYFSCTIKY